MFPGVSSPTHPSGPSDSALLGEKQWRTVVTCLRRVHVWSAAPWQQPAYGSEVGTHCQQAISLVFAATSKLALVFT